MQNKSEKYDARHKLAEQKLSEIETSAKLAASDTIKQLEENLRERESQLLEANKKIATLEEKSFDPKEIEASKNELEIQAKRIIELEGMLDGVQKQIEDEQQQFHEAQDLLKEEYMNKIKEIEKEKDEMNEKT